MKFDWIKRSAELKEKGTPFAIATVIKYPIPKYLKVKTYRFNKIKML